MTLTRSFSDIPTPKEHWLKGSLGCFHPEKLHTFTYNLAEELGYIFKIRLLAKPLVVVSDPRSVNHILKQRPSRYRRVERMESVFKEMGTHGAFSAEGVQWKDYRQLIGPAFKPSNIKRMLPVLRKNTQRCISVLDQQPKVLDIQVLLQKLLVDMTSELAFGYDVNTLEGHNVDLQAHLTNIFQMAGVRTKAPLPLWRLFSSQRDKELKRSLSVAFEAVSQFIAEAKKSLLEKDGQPSNILEALLAARNEQGQPYSDAEIYGNVMTILLAGEDTTANTLAWTFHFLSVHTEFQELLHQEIIANYPASGELRWEDLDNFPLVYGAIQESMRLRPVAPFLFLQNYQDEVIENYRIPKNTTIVCLLAHGGKNPEVFPEPNAFNPLRWRDLTDEQKQKYAVEIAPFGGGPRLCPGMQLSIIEQKLVMIEVLKRFMLTPSVGYQNVDDRYRFSVMPEGLRVDVARREGIETEVMSGVISKADLVRDASQSEFAQ